MGTVRIPVLVVVLALGIFAVTLLALAYFAGVATARREQATLVSPVRPTIGPRAYPSLTPLPTDTPTATPTPTETPTSTPTPVPTPTPTPVVVTKNFQFHVRAGQAYTETLELSAGATLIGAFNLSTNDINFALWRQEPGRARLLSQDRVQTYQFSYTAESAGTYALVFDNRYSIFSGKDIRLSYAITEP